MENGQELTLEEKQSILFDIMKEIDVFCRANGIKYSLSDGTMLGAVRHNGFIPWDDDADICMLREDFDKFAKTFKSDKYHLLYDTNDENEVLYSGYIKVNDPTTYIPNLYCNAKYGVNVDIFPIESVPEDLKERKTFYHRVRSLNNRLWHRHKKDLLSIIKTYRHSKEYWWNKVDEAVHDGNAKYAGSTLAGQILGIKEDHVLLRKDMFDNLKDYSFEGYNFLGFEDYHTYLMTMFGPDYMIPKKYCHNFTIYRR